MIKNMINFKMCSLDDNNLTTKLNVRDQIQKDEDSQTITKGQVKRPRLYKVLIYNDDYTTMEFVVMILQKVFSKSTLAAQEIMLQVHNQGVGVCGVYTFEIAESKVVKVRQLAKEQEHPLRCSYEPE